MWQRFTLAQLMRIKDSGVVPEGTPVKFSLRPAGLNTRRFFDIDKEVVEIAWGDPIPLRQQAVDFPDEYDFSAARKI